MSESKNSCKKYAQRIIIIFMVCVLSIPLCSCGKEYENTIVPTFTSVLGIDLLKKTNSYGVDVYIYSAGHDSLDEYIITIKDCWFKEDTDSGYELSGMQSFICENSRVTVALNTEVLETGAVMIEPSIIK